MVGRNSECKPNNITCTAQTGNYPLYNTVSVNSQCLAGISWHAKKRFWTIIENIYLTYLQRPNHYLHCPKVLTRPLILFVKSSTFFKIFLCKSLHILFNLSYTNCEKIIKIHLITTTHYTIIFDTHKIESHIFQKMHPVNNLKANIFLICTQCCFLIFLIQD